MSKPRLDVQSFLQKVQMNLIHNIWVKSRNCGCLVTWFCYQLIAKPGNKTATVSWPDPYVWRTRRLHFKITATFPRLCAMSWMRAWLLFQDDACLGGLVLILSDKNDTVVLQALEVSIERTHGIFISWPLDFFTVGSVMPRVSDGSQNVCKKTQNDQLMYKIKVGGHFPLFVCIDETIILSHRHDMIPVFT